MGCLTSTQVAAIKAKILTLESFVEAAETAYLGALTNSETEEYRFDSAEGSQRVQSRSPIQIRKEIEAIESQIARLNRKLNGTSNVNMNLRRRSRW